MGLSFFFRRVNRNRMISSSREIPPIPQCSGSRFRKKSVMSCHKVSGVISIGCSVEIGLLCFPESDFAVHNGH